MNTPATPEEKIIPPESLARLRALDAKKMRISISLSLFLSAIYIGIFVWAVQSPDSFGYRIAGSAIGLGVTVFTLFVLLCFATTLHYANAAEETLETEEELISTLVENGTVAKLNQEIASRTQGGTGRQD